MLERYFIKPATIDRIRANWLGPHIEHYVEWLNSEGYAERNVFRRVPILCQFGELNSSNIKGRPILNRLLPMSSPLLLIG